MIDFLYNNCYGGFGFSKEFEEEFSKRFPEKKDILKTIWNNKIRYDKDVVSLWKEMGDSANDSYSKIQSKLIPEACIEFVDIKEYDGMESVRIDWNCAYTRICHNLVEAIKNRHDITQILHDYDDIKATYREYMSTK